MDDNYDAKNEKTVLAEKSGFIPALYMVLTVFLLIIIICAGFPAPKSFWNFLSYILLFTGLILSVYFKFLVPKNVIEYDKKGIYINKPFKRTLFIEYKDIGGAECTVYKTRRGEGSLYNEFNEVGNLIISVKRGNDDYYHIKAPYIFNVSSAASILNILKDRYGGKK